VESEGNEAESGAGTILLPLATKSPSSDGRHHLAGGDAMGRGVERKSIRTKVGRYLGFLRQIPAPDCAQLSDSSPNRGGGRQPRRHICALPRRAPRCIEVRSQARRQQGDTPSAAERCHHLQPRRHRRNPWGPEGRIGPNEPETLCGPDAKVIDLFQHGFVRRVGAVMLVRWKARPVARRSQGFASQKALRRYIFIQGRIDCPLPVCRGPPACC